MSRRRALVPVEHIVPSIYTIRGQLVLLDPDLAALYDLTPKEFSEQVQRNLMRFGSGFVFQLSAEETEALKSQLVPVNFRGDGLPYAFTEHGAIVAAMILNNTKAIEMSAQVAGAFIQLREQLDEVLTSNHGLESRVALLERRIDAHEAIISILELARDVMMVPNAVRLTQAQRTELGRRLNEYQKKIVK